MKLLQHLQQYEKKRLAHSLILPFFFAFLMIAVKTTESLENVNWFFLGIHPLKIEGLLGILTMPFIHADWKHLWNNLPSFIILSVGVFYFYRPIGYKIFFTIYFLANILLWCVARHSWHVGASGLIYGLAAFLFISGIFRRYIPLLAITLLVAFLYGSMVWGLFPWHQFVTYSWEGHFWGSFAGIVSAIIYRKQGPQRPIPEEIIEEEQDDEFPYWEVPNSV